MSKNKEKVIIFPKWKSYLEKSSMEALNNKNYDEALQQFDELLQLQVCKHEIVLGKLICLMELGYTTEALRLSESKLDEKDRNYFDYVQIYVTLLFQTNQFEEVIDQIAYELKKEQIPKRIREQFQQLYEVSKQMRNDVRVEQAKKYEYKLKEAFKHNDPGQQYHWIEKLRSIKRRPFSDVKLLLQREEVHPVVKTIIFQWLQDDNYSNPVTVQKFNKQQTYIPSQTVPIFEEPLINETLKLLGEVEQQNPTLYDFAKKLLYRYTYVIYPFLYPSRDQIDVKEAIILITSTYLNMTEKTDKIQTESIKKYVKDIKICSALYASIIEDETLSFK